MWTLFIDCIDIGKIRLGEKLRIKNKLCTALELVQKDIMEPFLLVHSGLSTSPVGALPFKAGEHNNLQHICAWNLGTSDIFNIIHPYYYLTENEENSRTSSFEEGAPDVGQIVAQEPIFHYYGQVLIGGPLNAYWARGASLGPDTFVIKSPWDHKYLWHVLETTNIFLETRPRRFSFTFVTSVSDTCMLSELYFHDFCVVFSWVLSLGWPFTFWGLYKAPIVTLELTIESYPFWELCFLLLSVLPC